MRTVRGSLRGLGALLVLGACGGTPGESTTRDAGVTGRDSGHDAAAKDAGPRDGGSRDATTPDAERDARSHDARRKDAATRDVATRDSAQRLDAGTDGGGSDAASDSADAETGPVTLTGAAAKGPFLLGTTITASAVDSSGGPTGPTLMTQTADDTGDFTLTLSGPGPTQLSANGNYYNELTQTLSTSALTLYAMAEVGAGSADVYVNLLTDLSAGRTKTLMGTGLPLAAAASQADAELYAQLQFAGGSFTPGGGTTTLNLLGGDTGAAYVLAASAIVIQASGGSDADVASLVSDLESDFSPDGALSTGHAAGLSAAAACVEPTSVNASVAARLERVGSSAPPPNMNLALDTDGDGVLNAVDSCVLIANADQSVVPNGVCNYDYVDVPPPASDSGSCITTAAATGTVVALDLDGDGNADLVALGCTDAFVWLGQAGGAFAAPVPLGLRTLLSIPATGRPLVSWLAARDMNHDGKPDVVIQFASCSGSTGCAQPGVAGEKNQNLAYLPGDGMGHLGSAAAIASGFEGFTGLVVADLNADDIPDVAGIAGLSVGVVLSGGDGGGWVAPRGVALPAAAASLTGIAVGNLRGGTYADLAISSSAGGVYLLPGDGSGAYAAPASGWMGLGANVQNVAVADMDGDGHPDILGTSFGTSPSLEIVWGDGTITPSGAPYVAPTTPTSSCARFSAGASCSGQCAIPFAIGDATGDGKLDLYPGGYPAIAVNAGNRTFAAPLALWSETYNGGTTGPSLLIDVNGDGVADVVSDVRYPTVVLVNQRNYFSW
jgi:hypothetical protein